MRKIIVTTMITLDGVMQAPGGPKEDDSNGFTYGGWSTPYRDAVGGKEVQKQMQQQTDYLLGRKTFENWENFWPHHADIWPAINKGTKYVLSNTMEKSDWKNTAFIKNVEDIQKVKESDGADIQVWGSSELVQLLFKHDLVDELWLKIYPVTLGAGKKLFGNGPIPAAFELTETLGTPKGIIFAYYKRAGEVEVGVIGA